MEISRILKLNKYYATFLTVGNSTCCFLSGHIFIRLMKTSVNNMSAFFSSYDVGRVGIFQSSHYWQVFWFRPVFNNTAQNCVTKFVLCSFGVSVFFWLIWLQSFLCMTLSGENELVTLCM